MANQSIKILPEDLINKIAAGEVVERPASVVKELVENAIDAGASQIIIEVDEAGKKLIRVADNGRGLTEAEIKLALQRHATSKLAEYDDLFNLHTLGFRGEALPSIAAVSKTKIERNPAGRGLTVTVKDLFHNTPARRKFLKANSTELGHCGQVAAKYALAYPGIAFRFSSDGKPLLTTGGTGQLADAILSVYGPEILKGLVEVSGEFKGGQVTGFVSRPTLTRIDKNYEDFFVNGRFIKNFLLNRALEEAYRTLIPHGRYPVAVIFLAIDPQQVDVNIHPAKREVKFVRNQLVMDGVREAVKKALGDQAISQPAGGYYETGRSDSAWQPAMADVLFPMDNSSFPSTAAIPSHDLPLFPLGQINNMYIVATGEGELTLIDQHAAHERILYDRLSLQSLAVSRQSLLMPETVEFPAPEAVVLKENLAYLNTLGFEIEEFGGNSFLLRSVPALSGQAAPQLLLQDIVADLAVAGKSPQIEVRQETVRKLVACHSAIKAGDKLTPQEMVQLIRDLLATANPLTCPHGRPTMVRISSEELAKRFGR
ncbi:MAG: DNA mismatch repair endonuclease MutL [Candidatus Margulisiibacteriota bacterium]